MRWRSDVALPGFDPSPGDDDAGTPVEVFRVDRLPDRPGGRALGRGFVHPDGVRFVWEDEAAFDMIDGDRIAYAPGRGWRGTMPAGFYGTVAALTAAWRGLVPLHASAVEVDGRAILIAGESGAGKSTLAAALLAAGARFVADDLTVASVTGNRILIAAGRPTMRLHPDTARRLDVVDAHPVAGDPRGKWLVRPRRRGAADALDLGAVLLLKDEAAAAMPVFAIDLFAHVYRPRWIDALPMRAAVMRDVLAIAARTPMTAYPAAPAFNAETWRRRADEAISLIRTAVRSSSVGL